jgi:hypothetical protein
VRQPKKWNLMCRTKQEQTAVRDIGWNPSREQRGPDLRRRGIAVEGTQGVLVEAQEFTRLQYFR